MANVVTWRSAIAATLGAVVAFFAPRPAAREVSQPPNQFSRAGKDMALVQTLGKAQKTIYVRSQLIELTPVVDALIEAQKRGIQTRIDLPLSAAQSKSGTSNTQRLMSAGATVQLSSDPETSFEGTYVVIDEESFFYAASPLSFSPPGAPRSYVIGKR
jgi:hypothetical protein